MKNAGKACNNRLYRHIRTFEKIVKNYFVIYITYVIGHQQVCDQSVLVAVHQILSDIMGWGDNIVVDLNTNLFKNGLIHTNKIKQLIIDLEKQFGITINHSNIKYTSLCSINSIGKLIGGIVDEKTKIDS